MKPLAKITSRTLHGKTSYRFEVVLVGGKGLVASPWYDQRRMAIRAAVQTYASLHQFFPVADDGEPVMYP